MLDSMLMTFFEQFHFLRPWWLLFIIPATLIYWLLTKETGDISQWENVMSDKILQQLTIKGNSHKLLSPKKVFFPFLLLTTLVLAGPSWHQQPSPFLKDDSVLIITLDLSSSMKSNDVKPTRLIRAKHKIDELLNLRGDSKTALIAFAGSAHIAMPISEDRHMIKHFLQVLDDNVMPIKAKDQTSILPKIEKLTRRTDSPVTVLLISDGTSSNAINAFKAYFTENKNRLIVWSMNKSNAEQQSQLQALALSSQGEFIAFAASDQDIKSVNNAIQTNMQNSADSALPWFDAGYYLIIVLMAIHLMWFRKGWTLRW